MRKFVMWHSVGFFFRKVALDQYETPPVLKIRCSSFDAFLLLVYTSKHVLFLTSLFTFIWAWYFLRPICSFSRKGTRILEIKDHNLVYWTTFFIFCILNFYVFIFYRIACNYFFILTIFILTVHGLQFSRTRKESKSRYWARNAALFDDLFTNHFCRGWGRDGDTTIPTVRMVLGAGVLGWPCGRAGNPVGIYMHP